MKLSTGRIITAGLELTAEVGYSALSMRQVADRLDAQAGSLYYHVKNKQDLLRLMADRLFRRAFDDATGGFDAAVGDGAPPAIDSAPADGGAAPAVGWRGALLAQAHALRQVMLSQPGGATLLVAAPKSGCPAALDLVERLLRTLLAAGFSRQSARVVSDAMLSYVSGFVLQEQTESAPPGLVPEDWAVLMARFPLVFEAGQELDDVTFAASLALICDGAAAGERL